jgi:uncharacterized protein YbcV (DUF1398 family)
MNAEQVADAARASLAGSRPFPEIVKQLFDNGVEYYQVDYASAAFRFYGPSGAMVTVPLLFEDLPPIAADFDRDALRTAILDSQQNGQKFRAFSQRATAAGVQGYFAFLRGQRVTYFGRQGDQHIEWFPGAKPTEP